MEKTKQENETESARLANEIWEVAFPPGKKMPKIRQSRNPFDPA